LREASSRTVQLPDNIKRFQPKLPIKDQQLIIQANREKRQQAREAQDIRVIALRQATQSQSINLINPGLNSQASIGSHITVRPREQSSVIYNLSSDDEPSSDEELPDIPFAPSQPTLSPRQPTPPPPPASTAPPRLQEQEQRTMRKRAGTGFYTALIGGDSQEIKRARQQ
jgi:hypothetical protein